MLYSLAFEPNRVLSKFDIILSTKSSSSFITGMSIAEFMNLSKFEKVNALNSYGAFIAERRLGFNRLYLYALNYFYVELLHELSNLDNRGITVCRVFDDVSYLDLYLEKVDISSLMEVE